MNLFKTVFSGTAPAMAESAAAIAALPALPTVEEASPKICNAYGPSNACALPEATESPSTLKLFSSSLPEAPETLSSDNTPHLLDHQIATLTAKLPSLHGSERREAEAQIVRLGMIGDGLEHLSRISIRRPGGAELVAETRSRLVAAVGNKDEALLLDALSKVTALRAYEDSERKMIRLVATLRVEYPEETSIPLHLDYSSANPDIRPFLEEIEPDNRMIPSEDEAPIHRLSLNDFEPPVSKMETLSIIATYDRLKASDQPDDIQCAAFMRDLMESIHADSPWLMEARDTRYLSIPEAGGSTDLTFENVGPITTRYNEMTASEEVKRFFFMLQDQKDANSAEAARNNDALWLQRDLETSLPKLEQISGLVAVLQTDPKQTFLDTGSEKIKRQITQSLQSYREFLIHRIRQKEHAQRKPDGMLFHAVSKEETELRAQLKSVSETLEKTIRLPIKGNSLDLSLLKVAAERAMYFQDKHVRESLSYALREGGGIYHNLEISTQPIKDAEKRLAALDPLKLTRDEISSGYRDVFNSFNRLSVLGSLETRIRQLKDVKRADTSLLLTNYQDLKMKFEAGRWSPRNLETFRMLERSSAHSRLLAQQESLEPINFLIEVALVYVAAETAGITTFILAPALEGVVGASTIALAVNGTAFVLTKEALDAAAFGWGSRLDSGVSVYASHLPEKAALNIGLLASMEVAVGVSTAGEIVTSGFKHELRVFRGETVANALWSPAEKLYHKKFDLTLMPEILEQDWSPSSQEHSAAFLLGLKSMHVFPITKTLAPIIRKPK